MTQDIYGPPPGPAFDIHPTQDQVAFFKENGFLAVERLTTDEEIDWLRAIFEHIFDPANAGKPGAPLDRSGELKEGEPSLLSQSFFPEMQFREILNTSLRRNSKRFAAALLGRPEETLTGWGHMIKKPPGGRSAPWHQDHAYWDPEFSYDALGVWVPMHDVTTEMGAMQFIPGSHKRGLLRHRHADAPEHNLLEVDEAFDAASAVSCELKKGGATFHHAETLHYTAPNTTQHVRLAFPTEYQIAPTIRPVAEKMPWVDQRRAATGGSGPNYTYVADGKLLPVKEPA